MNIFISWLSGIFLSLILYSLANNIGILISTYYTWYHNKDEIYPWTSQKIRDILLNVFNILAEIFMFLSIVYYVMYN